MKASARARRDRIRAQLADPKMPGALEALDEVLAKVDGGATASEAIEDLLGAQITLRNNRRLQAAMRSSRLPVWARTQELRTRIRSGIGITRSCPESTRLLVPCSCVLS